MSSDACDVAAADTERVREPAASSGPVAQWVDRALISVTGPDTTSFLQGQLSQDVAAIEVGHSSWSLLLAPQGKVDAWVRLHRVGPEEVLVEVDATWAETVIARLSRFKLRVDCEIGPAQGARCLEVRGAGVEAVARPDGSMGQALVAPSNWPGEPGFDVVAADPAVPAGVVVDPDAVERRRIRAGVPRLGRELDDTVIPAEAGRWLVESSVSFTKGCYVGQELVARIDSRGSNTPRRLRGVCSTGPLAEGAELTDERGKVVGRITSAVADPTIEHPNASVALAFLLRSIDVPGRIGLAESGTVELFEVPAAG